MKVRLSTVEYLDEHGRLIMVQFWSYLEATRFAAKHFLIDLRV